MTRRGFVGLCTALLAAPLTFVRGRRYGLMTVERWRAEGFYERGASCLLDGKDITGDCYQFHDGEGWADVFLRDADGNSYLNESKDDVVRRRLYGRMTVRQ